MVTRAAVVAEARDWIGSPFRHQGYLKGVGVDCIGLIGAVGLALGIDGGQEWLTTPAWHNYARQPDPRLLLDGCKRFLDKIQKVDVQPGDIVLMNFEADPMHFAIVTTIAPMYVVHSLARLGRVAEHIVDAKWGAYIKYAFSYRGIE